MSQVTVHMALWTSRAHWWDNLWSGEETGVLSLCSQVFQSLTSPRDGCLKDTRDIRKTKPTPLLHKTFFLSLGWIEMIWGESHFNLKILPLPKLHAKKWDALLLFAINNVTLYCSQVFHSSLYHTEILSWIKPSERRWGDALCLIDYFTVTEAICFLCLLSTNTENKPYTRRRDFFFLPNSIEINSLSRESPRNFGFKNKLLDYWLSSLMVQAALSEAGGSSSKAGFGRGLLFLGGGSEPGQGVGTKLWEPLQNLGGESRHCLLLERWSRWEVEKHQSIY